MIFFEKVLEEGLETECAATLLLVELGFGFAAFFLCSPRKTIEQNGRFPSLAFTMLRLMAWQEKDREKRNKKVAFWA